MKNIWKELSDKVGAEGADNAGRPLLVQAPMEDVTDTVFRRMIAEAGRPDLFYTEFTNVDGMFSYGRDKVTRRLQYTEGERPLIAQIWGANPDNYFEAAKYLVEAGFDGIDINMGCPQRKVVGKGLCAALIDNHELAREIIEATIEGAGAHGEKRRIPVSVKTRIGVKEIQTDEWVRFLLGFDIAALILHGRTVKEMSKVPAHWDEIGKAVQIRDEIEADRLAKGIKKDRTLIIGNGDVKSRAEAFTKAKKYGVDGVMIARGIFDDIGVFSDIEPEKREMDMSERLALLNKHLDMWNETWGEEGKTLKSFNVLKKYVKVYVKGISEASDVRAQLMETTSFEEMSSKLKKLRELHDTQDTV